MVFLYGLASDKIIQCIIVYTSWSDPKMYPIIIIFIFRRVHFRVRPDSIYIISIKQIYYIYIRIEIQ